jgi:hypothetical protein
LSREIESRHSPILDSYVAAVFTALPGEIRNGYFYSADPRIQIRIKVTDNEARALRGLSRVAAARLDKLRRWRRYASLDVRLLSRVDVGMHALA